MSAPSWLTGKADAASLPALLEALEPRVQPTTIDELYLFPMRRVQGVESTVLVFSLHDAEEMRRVITAEIRATRNKRGEPAIDTRLNEHALAPAERIPRIIEGVLKRLSEDFAATPPSHARIEQSVQRWRALIDVLMAVPKGQSLPEELLDAETAEAQPARAEAEGEAEVRDDDVDD